MISGPPAAAPRRTGQDAAVRQVGVLVGSFVAVFGFLTCVVLGAGLGAAAGRAVGLDGGARGVVAAVGCVGLAGAWAWGATRLWRRLR
jgi:hypothetical protein